MSEAATVHEKPDQHAEEPAAGNDEPEQPNEQRPEEENDRPQDPWAARRELHRHAPTVIGGSLVGGHQTGVSGGNVTGDVVLGTKVEHHYRFGAATHTSGSIPANELHELASVFAGYEELVHPLLDKLRDERVLVLSGAPFSGRRSAALMLLHALDAVPIRALDPKTRPTALNEQVIGGTHGYLVTDLATGHDAPLRDIDLWSVRDELKRNDAYLVITVDLFAILHGVDVVEWKPPSPESVLRSHLHTLVDDPPRERGLLGLPPVQEFLGRTDHQLREAAEFAKALCSHAEGKLSLDELASFGSAMVREQVREWFGDDETSLRDKAFLISLAAFDEAAYALTAEVSDDLYARFQGTEDANRRPRVGVFGTSITKRLRLARATEYWQEEHTEWGPVTQRMACFEERRVAAEVLREVWTGHPSARPGLIRWLERLAEDGRPLVRTRAAVAAAVLAQADLPSAMALLIEGWAKSKRYRDRLVAANALATAHAVGAPNIPEILRTWCDGDPSEAGLRWTAIRGYALVGAMMPREALAALADAARTGEDVQEARHVAESAALLLTDESSTVREQVLRHMVELLQDEPPVRRLALHAFVLACTHTDDLLILQWYATADERGGTEDARHLCQLWRMVLNDLRYTGEALQALGDWVREADQAPQVERYLAVLLPALAVTGDDRKRLKHLLATVRGRRGGAPPAVAGRLSAAL
ncbi:hypothetical protein [Streptomyces sp. NPDC047108]|uniref:hypothetical protein n=1 Tax=Streptomyces sp. NPDC047108 TaxID=3155025 RepID=UPI0033C85B8F